MKDNTLKNPEEQQQLIQENEMLKNELKNLEEFITKVLLEHRQLTALEYMQKLLNDDSAWTETNKLLVNELVKEVKKGNCNDNYIIEIIKNLEERIENDEETIEYWKKRTMRGEEDAAIHFEALTETSKEWNEKKLKWTIENNEKIHNDKTKDLEKQVSDKTNELKGKTEKLERSNKIIENRDAEIIKLKQLLQQEKEHREKANKIILVKESQNKDLTKENKKLKNRLNLAEKDLPTLPKKQSKFKQLRTKVKTMKTKFHQLVEKKKHQTQELIARIEVKTN